MAVAAGTQALIATFALSVFSASAMYDPYNLTPSSGLVALASTSTACLFTFGNRRLRGNAPLQNGLRLVLVTFLLSAALWSIMDFAATLITANANPSCQVLVSVAAGFDQLARVAFEQFLLLRIKSKSIYKSIYVLQAFIPVRFILGGVLIAVQRPQTYPVCIAKNILLSLGIATLVTDAVITSNLAPARIVCFLTAGFAAWLATSIPMIFGLEIFSLASRTVVPSVGLLILIGLVALFRRHALIADSDLQLSPSTIDTSKALPSRPTENRNTAMSQEVFNRPWGGPSPHVARAQRPSTGPLPMPKAGSRGVTNALPIINRPAPGQTERGVGGIPVQGQLFPPTRANTAPVVLQNPPKKQPKGKLAISNPIIRQSSALKIQDKIPTVDLALAAKNDQQRRGAAPGAVVLDRAGQTQSLTRNNLDASLKRKQVGSAGAVPTFSSERSVLLPNSATTATQLSPSEDELRRRSPRPPRDSSKMLLSPPPRSPKRPSGSASQKPDNAPPLIPPQSPLRRSAPVKSVLRPTSAIFIDSGRPPAIPMNLRQNNSNWSDSSPAVSPLVPRVEPLPMPLPRTRSDATPSAAYKSAAAAAARASVLTRGGTGSVRRDIRPSRQRPESPSIGKQDPAPAKTRVQLRSANGIPMNPRARPARDPSGDVGERTQTIMFPTKIDLGGAGQPASRQIFALSLASSSASTDSIVHRPRPIPRKSSIYKADFTIKVSPTVYRHRLSRSLGSVELPRGSMESGSDTISRIPSFPEPPKSASAVLALGSYKKSSDSASKAVTPGSINESHNDSVSFPADRTPSKAAGTVPKSAFSESTEFGSRSNMEPDSAYDNRRQSSPVLPVEEMPQISDDNARVSRPSSARSVRSTASQHNDEEEIVPMVLDAGSRGSFSGPSFQRNSLAQLDGWHRRLGDALPTFSDRKDGGPSPRRTLVPAPLQLGKSSNPTRNVESQAPPLESPQHALDLIQQQLKDLDEADSETGVEDKQRRRLLENLEAEMGAQETHWQDIRRNLADRSPSSTRSSLSLVPSGDLHLRSPRPSPALRSHNPAVPVIGRGADPVSAPGKHTLTPADEKSNRSPSELTRRSNSGFTEQRSAQGISGGVENRAKFGKSASRNTDGLPSVTMTNAISTHRQLTNDPTSPDFDKFEQQVENDEQLDFASAKLNNYSAWTPGSVNLAAVEKTPLPVSHWSIDSDTAAVLLSESLKATVQDPGHPAKTVAGTLSVIGDVKATQSPQRIDQVIGSPTTSSPTLLHQESLVSPAFSEQTTQSPRRPVTQKPPRRSKRITLLPDILESPQPLDNKRGTLGIFQFPWGETSDIATLQPQLSSVYSVPLPGTTLNELAFNQGYYSSQVPSLPSQTYPASFFDHYSDDDDLPAADSDGSTGGYSDDEDEAFDETTLWEIANLLRSNEIPSRNSLFPGSEEDRPPSRAGFTSADEATISAVRHLPIADLEESTLGSEDNDLSPPPLLENSLWKPKTMYTTATRSAGLTQPDEMTWGRYLGKQTETLRSAPRKSEPAIITSTSLWALKPNQSDVLTNAAANGLWRPTVEASITPSSTAPSTPFLASPLPTESSIGDMFALPKVTTRSHELWTPSAPVAVVSFGLPQDEQEWGRYTDKKLSSSRHKPRPSAQDAIYSTSLWVSSRPAAVAPAPPCKPASSTQPLWSKPAALPAEQTKGLWNASHIRHQYRTTDQRPAALYTARKLRTDRRPLPALRSASLWSTTTQTPARQVPDWLALSTTLRPISPGGASSSDQDQDDAASASFDSNSLRSEVTAASSVATSKQSAAHRKTASKQAAQEELDAAFRDVMQAGKPSVAMPVAVPEEENAEQDKEELEEDGQSEEKEEPQEKGGPEEKEELYFDSSRLHPVFAVDVLHAIDENVHPAATGYLHYVVNGAPKPRRR
ncbi:hypothetical protein ARSEF1564_002331 [Beauveria bassiana]